MTKKKKKTIITLCSSASFYKEVLDVQEELRKLGFIVKIPHIAYTMRRTGNYDVNHYKTWHKDKNDYKKKTNLMNLHFKKVSKADAILVVNKEKNGIKGYVGGNVLLEMFLAYYLKKPIYILNPIDEYYLTEEVYGMNPIFLNGDLTKIRK